MDETSLVLIDYIKETELIAKKALNKLDKNSNFQIVPAVDVGIPFHVERLAGGFPTGAFVEWNCAVPIIPIDTNVNCCTASVFELSNKCDDVLFKHNLRMLINSDKDSTYQFNFNKGNHFISLCYDNKKNWYLILHSSAKEFSVGYNGLIPVKGNWYYDKIITYEENNRYFRYIKGTSAELFARIAISLNKYNEVRHEFTALNILRDNVDIKSIKHYHHYGMGNCQSINVGCYNLMQGDCYPLFTKPGYPIDMFEIRKCNYHNWAGELIAPHGWGKKYDGSLSIKTNYSKNRIIISDVPMNLFEDNSLYSLPQVKYRDFDNNGNNEFYEYFKHYIDGCVRNRFFQHIYLNKSSELL